MAADETASAGETATAGNAASAATPSGYARFPSFQPMFQTDLAQTPLPEMLVTIHRYKAPGVIECRQGEVVKRIYLDRGQIIFATTNQLSESLGDKLLREGKITREQYDDSVAMLRTTGKRHGVTLVEMNLITPQELFRAVREQLQEIVWSLFAWDHGAVTFAPGRDKALEFVKVELSIPEAIVRGVRAMPDPRALIARHGTRTTLLSRTEHPLEEVTLSAEEQKLLDTVDGKKPLFTLVATPPLSQADNARLLYAYFALQLIAVRQPVKVQLKTEGGKFPAA
jgi:hypothetical protein